MAHVGNNSYSHLIITPDIKTPSTAPLEAAALKHESAAATWAARHQARETANSARESSVQSLGSESMHRVHREIAQEARILSEAHTDAAKVIREQITILTNVATQHASIDKAAHEKINQTKSQAAIPGIISEHNTSARLASTRGAAAATKLDAKWVANHETKLAAIIKLAPVSGPIEPAPPNSPGITRPLDNKTKARQGEGDDPRKPESPPEPTEVGSGADGGQPTPGKGHGESAPGAERAQYGQTPGSERTEFGAVPGGSRPGTSAAPSMPSRPTVSPLGGGVPSGGGGSGASGLGSGLGGGSSPLSSLMGGVGQNPASSLGSGLSSTNPASGLANSGGGPAAGANPGAAFARGLSSTGSAVPPMASTVAPPPAAANPTLPPQPAGGGSSGVAPPAGAAGVHVSPAGTPVSAPPVMSGGAPAPPMMLPSTGMGNPAATAGPVVPVGSSSTPSAGGGGAAVGSAGSVPANSGATLVPAAVMSSAMSSRPRQLLTEDAQSAAALAWQLQHACRMVNFPMDWAVGVFRSSEGSETVIMSSEGSGYIPAGVFVPRGVRLLAADVDPEFRRTWFGWRDPAEVMVEYARGRQSGGWRLAAAATTSPVDQFRDFGTEYADQCTFERSPLTVDDPIPVLDPMHAHRLQLENADLYDRLLRLSSAEQVYVDRVMIPVAGELVEAARSLEHPVELTRAWATVTGGGELTGEQWAQYAQVTSTEFLTAQVLRPEAAGPPEEWKAAVYRDAWTVCRSLEVIAGWASRPLPVADMAYAAIAAEPDGDVRDRISGSLQQIEIELGWV